MKSCEMSHDANSSQGEGALGGDLAAGGDCSGSRSGGSASLSGSDWSAADTVWNSNNSSLSSSSKQLLIDAKEQAEKQCKPLAARLEKVEHQHAVKISELCERDAETMKELTHVAKELQTFIDTANAPIFGVDCKGLVNVWNDKAAEITRFTRQEVVGRDLVLEFITEEYRESAKAVLDDALRGKETANLEFALYTKDKRRVDVQLNATTRRDSSGGVVGMIGVGQDITGKRFRTGYAARALALALLAGFRMIPLLTSLDRKLFWNPNENNSMQSLWMITILPAFNKATRYSMPRVNDS